MYQLGELELPAATGISYRLMSTDVIISLVDINQWNYTFHWLMSTNGIVQSVQKSPIQD
jgi:hypothetical protein